MAEIGFGAEGDEEAELVEGGKEITESACLSLHTQTKKKEEKNNRTYLQQNNRNTQPKIMITSMRNFLGKHNKSNQQHTLQCQTGNIEPM